MNNSTSISGHIACFTAYAIFGVLTLRSLGAGLIFWILSLFLPAEKVEKKDYLKILAAAFLGYFVTQLTFLVAIPDVTPMHCSIISSMSPI